MIDSDFHVIIVGAGLWNCLTFSALRANIVTGATGLLIAQGLKKVAL
jgi:hypothetical protein